MGLLDRLKLNKTKDFFEWLDLILKNELNSEIKAINFNLYEDTDNKWSVELVGTFSFDKDNDDWACDEVFTTRDQPFVIECESCLLYTSPSPRDRTRSRMPSSA